MTPIKTPEQHRTRHGFLHQAIDEALACYLATVPGAKPSTTTVLDFLKWSHDQTLEATAPDHHQLVPIEARALVAHDDEPDLLQWLFNAHSHAGDFLKAIADAALRADHGNYPAMRPLVVWLRNKYPDYEPANFGPLGERKSSRFQ